MTTNRTPTIHKETSSSDASWPLKDAKARLSEVVQQAERQPQTLTVHGKPRAVVISTAEYARLKGQRTGAVLIELLEPLRGISFGDESERSPVRDVDL